jgi:glucan phosphoethanolaminetransferase (alkaline phosphatase superfamily)
MVSIIQLFAVIVVLILLLQVRIPYLDRYLNITAKMLFSFAIIFILYFIISKKVFIAFIIAFMVVIILYSLNLHYVNTEYRLYENFEEKSSNSKNLINKINSDNNDTKVSNNTNNANKIQVDGDSTS